MEQTSPSGYPLWVGRVRRWGNSYVLVLPTWVRERLLMLDGSLVAMRVHPPHATMRVWPPVAVVNPATLSADKLPPAKPEDLKDA